MHMDTEFQTQQVVEAFLSVAIVGVSTAFIISSMMGGGNAFIPLSLIFYSVLPLAMALIGYLTFKVAKLMYDNESNSYFQMMSPTLMSILLAVVAVNIGFMMVVTSSSSLTQIGTIRTSYLIVILSVALSTSVLLRNFSVDDTE